MSRRQRKPEATRSHMLAMDPVRYLLRSILAGMYLSVVVFVYWSLMNNLHENAYGKIVASGFFGVGLAMIVLTNTELFTSNNLYLAISSYEGTTTWRQTLLLWIVCYIGNLGGAIIVDCCMSPAASTNCRPTTRFISVPNTKCMRRPW